MQAVGRLGSYITQGVYTVSGPFHPFGGAVDIVVVQQQDGSFKSSPWYVRFGKFQGVLKAKEKLVGINVNGVEADFHMHLDHKGEAFFLREVDAEESESVSYPSSSSDDTDDNRARDHMRPGLPFKPKSCNFDSERSNSLAQIDVNNVKVVARTCSSHSRILGLIFGRRSFGRGVVEDGNVKRVDSLERAEIAANLLELKWSTNLAGGGRPPREDSELNEEACSRTEQRGISSESTKIDIAKDVELDPNAKEVINDRTRSDSQVACAEPEARMEKQLNGEEVSGLSILDIPGNNVPEEDTSTSGVQSLVECETSESSKVGMDFSSDQTPHEELCLASRGCGEVHVLAEVTVTEEATKMVDLGVPVMKVSEFHSQQTDFSDFEVSVHDVADVEDTPTFPKSQTVNMGLGHCSAEEFELNYDTKASSYISLNDQAIDDNNIKDKYVSSMLSSHQESVTDCFSRKTSRSPSASSEEESFLFSDLDKIRIHDQFDGSVSPEYVDKEDNLSYEDGTEKVNQLVDANCNLHSSTEKSTTENQTSNLQQLRVMSSPIDIPRNEAAGEEFGQLIASLPNISSSSGSLGPYDVFYPLSKSLDSKSKSLQWTFPGEDDSKCLGSDDNKENQPSHEELGAKDDDNSGEFKSTVLKLPVGDLSGQSPSPGGNWRIWPFSFRRSRSRSAMLPAPSDAKNTTFGNSSGTMTSTEANKNGYKPNLMKKMVRENTPTSEQLASLNLKEGRNTVSFAFSTAMLGKQRVDARIYLWKWNTHIVISDVDGTITKSDVLGQFMPLVGVDWSQTGVTHLFSAIKENGYQLLFLSARSISQAYLTRQFLLNLKQDGKALPDGPVVISPDGLFPSLYREVIRRVPHEFKIACLEDIRALFPPDRNPFYAGFGNRDTDEISYLKVGVPKGKIFIINPRGEIVVNHYLNKKSYTSLHALVNGVFPPMNSSEQQEDFNSWNFWKLPPSVIDT